MGGSEFGAIPEDVAVATCLAALDQGINLIDTAPIYGHGRAEEIVGKAIAAHGRRDAFFVATKAGLEWNEHGVYTNSTAPRLRLELEDSLRRLGTDYIDLYQIHWPDVRVPLAETAALLAEFQREGKVRAVAVSNFNVAQMRDFRSGAGLASNQLPYNLFERQIDRATAAGEAVLPWCAANGVAVLTWSSLCRSLLGGHIERGKTFARNDIRSVDPKFQEPRLSQYLTAVERLGKFARERYGKTVPELAARWVLDQPGVTVALWGARRPDQLDIAGGVSGWQLDAAAMAEIDRILAASVTDPIGPEYLTPRVREG
jgi:aryl-alcohol dehydrogenase-like predicted oxidoreductase